MCREVAKLVAFGSRRGTNWLASQPLPGMTPIPPCFRWNDPGYMISFIKDPEARVENLRTLCEGYGVANSSTIIRYWVAPKDNLVGRFEFATTTRPPPVVGPKRYADGSVKPTALPPTRFIHIKGGGREYLRYRSHKCGEKFAYASPTWVFMGDELTSDTMPAIGPVTTYELIFGNAQVAGVYRTQARESEGQQATYKLDPGTLNTMLRHASFDEWSFMTSFMGMFRRGRGLEFGHSLFALAKASQFYNINLPSSTVSMTVITKPLYNSLFDNLVTREDPSPKAKLSTQHPSRVSSPMTRAAMFSLILHFESGTISVPAKSLQDVMAISCGNSLFVAGHLLADPAENLPSHSVQKIPGNIGRPGIALLIPPETPRIRKAELDKWNLIEHAAFDGTRPVGRFEGTSVQLSFTGYEFGVVDTGQQGLRGRAAFFSETRVSVHSQGAWVADVNLLGGIESRELYQECADRSHSGGPPDMTCISIDNWEEILDPPTGLGVVRATGDWITRLSAVAVATQKKYLCLVVRDDIPICWDCIRREARDRGRQGASILLVI